MDIKTLIKLAKDNPTLTYTMMNYFSRYFEEHKEEAMQLFKQIYIAVYGEHFTDWLAKEAVSKMKNADGSTGEHWTFEQAKKVAQDNGIDFADANFNEYDWYYVLNMAYSDLKPLFGDNAQYYINYVKLWLTDVDVDKGKAFRYYVSVVEKI